MRASTARSISREDSPPLVSADSFDPLRRRRQNRDTAIFLVGYIAVCILFALHSLVLYVWCVELSCAVTLVAIFMFSYSIKDYASDHQPRDSAISFLFAFLFEAAYFYTTARTSPDYRLAPAGLFLFISGQWFQVIAFLFSLNRKRPRADVLPVALICTTIAAALMGFHLFFPEAERYISVTARYRELYRWASAGTLVLFHGHVLHKLVASWPEQPEYFARRSLGMIICSALSCAGLVLGMGAAPALTFPFYLLRFVALALCYNANVTFTLLSPYRSLHDELSARADELAAANGRLNKALAEKEVLLGEVHHRVKNNLQVISSLLSLQSFRYEDEAFRVAIEESQNRIRAMALVHEMLYTTKDFAAVDFADYLEQVAYELTNSSGRSEIRVVADCEPMQVPVAEAITCGLITNELVSNCFKHAFPSGRPGTVRVTLRAIGPEIELSVADDGVGMGPGPGEAASRSMGLSLLEGLCSQLHGSYSIESGEGTRVTVRFSPTEPISRPT